MNERECKSSPSGKHRWLKIALGEICTACRTVRELDDKPHTKEPGDGGPDPGDPKPD